MDSPRSRRCGAGGRRRDPLEPVGENPVRASSETDPVSLGRYSCCMQKHTLNPPVVHSVTMPVLESDDCSIVQDASGNASRAVHGSLRLPDCAAVT
jgi:hypothetical protein